MSDTAKQPAAWATSGLFWAWLAHDLEEAATMSGWSERAADMLQERGWALAGRRLRMTRSESTLAIAFVGGAYAAAAVAGRRTGGRSPWFQAALTGFGWHALTHVAASAAFRGYTPGVLTAPTLVAPYTLAAVRELRKNQVTIRTETVPTVTFAATVPLAHLAARLTIRIARRARTRLTKSAA